jgi:hypothetical protein
MTSPRSKILKNKNATVLVVTGILIIGLLIFGLLSTQDTAPLSPADQHDSMQENTHLWMNASISKGTLLLLLAVGIAGVLGVSRKKKDIKNSAKRSESNHPSKA